MDIGRSYGTHMFFCPKCDTRSLKEPGRNPWGKEAARDVIANLGIDVGSHGKFSDC